MAKKFYNIDPSDHRQEKQIKQALKYSPLYSANIFFLQSYKEILE